MITRILALFCAIALPISAGLWYRSHSQPSQRRFDLTLYKSVWLYLSDGVCAMNVLSMPNKTPSRSFFRSSFNHKAIATQGRFTLSTKVQGLNRLTWVVFPMWLPTGLLALTLTASMLRGPARVWVRKRRGCCTYCGYSLFGNRTGRCPECGTTAAVRRRSTTPITPPGFRRG